MSTQFRPIEIPPGVVATATKKMRSTNYAEVNLVRWVEGQLVPIGGQARFNYTFASTCRAIHGWFDLGGVYHIAYVCETNVYVDTGGQLTEITPTGGLPPPNVPGQGGYGDLNYGEDTYGTPRTHTAVSGYEDVPPIFSVSNFGQILLVMTSPDGRLLQWDPSAAAGTKLTQAANSPLGRSFVVTAERFVIIFGMLNVAGGGITAGSGRRFGWCDQENYTNWDFANVASKAGFYDVEPASTILTALTSKSGTLMFTGKKVYLISFTGLPYIYSYVELADGCTPWSPMSICATSSTPIWMSQQGMWAFDGTSLVPLVLPIRPWIDDDINPLYVRSIAFAVHVGSFNEFWWFFPQSDKNYNTRVAIYNYKEKWCSQGQMSRSAGITSSYVAHPIMADRALAFFHETGIAYGNADLPWIETFDLNILNGSRLITVKQMMPDVEGNIDQLLYRLLYRNSRSTGTPELQSPQQPVRPDGYVDFRTTGRDIRLRIDLKGPNVFPVTVGQHLIDAVPRGDR